MNKIKEAGKLDGHFWLFNKNGIIQKIKLEIFKKVNPNFIVFVSSYPEEIQKRLKSLDGKVYSISMLQEMQIYKEKHAKEIASSLKIPYFYLTPENLPEIINLMLKPNANINRHQHSYSS